MKTEQYIFLKFSLSWKTRNHWLGIIIAGSKKEYSIKIIYEEFTAFVSMELALNLLWQKITFHNYFTCGWSMPVDIIFHDDINILAWYWWKLIWVVSNSTISHAVVQWKIPNMNAIFFQKKLKPESSSRAFLKYPILDFQESFLLLISNRFEFYHRSPKKSLNNTFSLLKNERDI